MKNSNNKQPFRPDGIVFVLVLVLSGFALFKPLMTPPKDEKMAQAKTRAESLGYQLLQLQADSKQPSKGRAPASVGGQDGAKSLKTEGSIGVDPWGSPYNYRIVQPGPTEPEVIEIWSQNLSDKVLITTRSKGQ